MAPCIKFFKWYCDLPFFSVLVITQQVYNKKYNKEDFLKDQKSFVFVAVILQNRQKYESTFAYGCSNYRHKRCLSKGNGTQEILISSGT